MLAWHMPSDVLGGYLVATFWTALAVAAVRAADRRWPPGARP
jgi:membrane-associated phospholipid phosphatase